MAGSSRPVQSDVTDRRLRVVMYHYVRDLPRTRFPQIKGLLTDDFRRQLTGLCAAYEMATLESAMEFLEGTYHPSRDLCLLTFDDGLKDHLRDVTPLLEEHRVQGLFFLITGCLEEGRVAAVHQNHFLMARLSFAAYQQMFSRRLRDLFPSFEVSDCRAGAARTYRWDPPEVAEFKYLFNFLLPEAVRAAVLESIFVEVLGDEAAFSRELYVTWDEAREMQRAGMVLGGHSHAHRPLAKLDADQQDQDVAECTGLLKARLLPQAHWPFSYPYGKPGDAFDEVTMQRVKQHGYCCAFGTAVGDNPSRQDRWSLCRIDTKDVGVAS